MVAADADEAVSRGTVLQPAAAIVQVGGAAHDGIETTKRLRTADRSLPILVVCGEDDAGPGMEALEAGADQMSLMPLGPSEVIARLDALLRRARQSARDSPLLSLEDLEIDVGARVVRQDDHLIRLTPIEVELLRFLAEHLGEAVPHGTLLVEIWGGERVADYRLVRSHIFKLRRKLEQGRELRYIHTEPGIGYRCGHDVA